MKRSLLATILSAALVMTSFSAAPARADEDVAKILAGIAFLAILNEASKSNKRSKARSEYVTRRHSETRAPRVKPRHVRKIAPQRCIREQWTHRGVREVYGAKCLQRRAEFSPPRACVRHANTNNGPRRFYTKRCLRKHGWRA